MEIIETKIPQVKIIEVQFFEDERGFLTENYNKELFDSQGLQYDFVQDFHTKSIKSGTVRGLHFQREPKAQTKLIRVTRGTIYDVILDIQRGSPTYGRWISVILSEENRRQLLVPKGFAHGYCTLSPNTEVMYKVDDFYSAEHYSGIRWDDPEIGIQWPISEIFISDKDQTLPFLKEMDNLFEYKGEYPE